MSVHFTTCAACTTTVVCEADDSVNCEVCGAVVHTVCLEDHRRDCLTEEAGGGAEPSAAAQEQLQGSIEGAGDLKGPKAKNSDTSSVDERSLTSSDLDSPTLRECIDCGRSTTHRLCNRCFTIVKL